MAELRQLKGAEIAQTRTIRTNKKGWQVPSMSSDRNYLVKATPLGATCNCPDFEVHGEPCKHIYAVEYSLTQNYPAEEEHEAKPTYPQQWNAYNRAQQSEKHYFRLLLADLVSNVPEAPQSLGRPTIPVADILFTLVYRTYSGLSGRRFTTDIKEMQEKGIISEAPHYNSLFNYLQKSTTTEQLAQMLEWTSKPFRGIETEFAMDSTGFGTAKFQRWFSYKHGRELRSRKWVKCHFVIGVKTNIITSAKITSELEADSPQFSELLQNTAERFDTKEILADKAYLSKRNLQEANGLNVTPYIPFKLNSKASGNGMTWKKMYHYFQLQREEFLQHYHKRSNAETTVHMIKAKFGDSVLSKKWNAQVNEVLCKIVAHNICVVIQEMHERGISPEFFKH